MECLPIYNANDSTSDLLHEALVVGNPFPGQLDMSPWLCAILGSTAIGVSGVLPILVIPVDRDFNAGGSPATFRLLLSFAVGCLLGDVWLHLLPEIWSHTVESSSANGGALWLLGGLLTFFILEKLLSSIPSTDPKSAIANPTENNNNNNENEKQSKLHISSGYLNLMANSMDNFTHGLAVGASFLVSVPRGVLTTAAILLHEIPHEVGDFAILLRSGFSRWDAVRAQLLTASAGLVGSLGAIYASGGGVGQIESRTAWMLPFTAGGFLHIALVTILPDLLEETSPTQSLLQLASMLGGVALMGGLASFTE